MIKAILSSIVIMGFSGLVAEILLLRELMVVFSGNELCIGLILANWLVLEAAGCYAASQIPNRPKINMPAYIWITVLFSIALVFSVFATRHLRSLLGVSVTESIGLLTILYSSFLVLLPVSFLHGALFTLACRIFSAHRAGAPNGQAGRVYVYETAGTMAGGVFCTLLFMTQANTINVTTAIATLNLIACVVLSLSIAEGKRTAAQYLSASALSLLLLASLVFLFGCHSQRLHEISVDRQWPNQNLVHYQNSQYGNIAIIENEGQYIYFIDGRPQIMTPIPDIPAVEEFVHLPLLAHSKPEKVLVLSGGAGGLINEVLKPPSIDSIRYAEIDPLLPELMRRYKTEITEREFADERVTLDSVDGRLLMNLSDEMYDVIFVGVDEPSSLQANRYFTLEFFRLASRRLREGGILVIGIPGSMALLNDEIKDLNSCIYHTLQQVFPHIRPIPGEERNVFLASQSSRVSEMDTRSVMKGIEESGISTYMLLPRNIENKLHQGWQNWFSEFIEDATTNINRDFKPLGLFYSIAHWNSLYAPAFGRVFKTFEKVNLISIGILLLSGFTVLALVRRKSKRISEIALPVSIASTGFAGMLFDLVVIFAFQAIYGYVFSWIGLLVALFMAGAAGGAILSNRIDGAIEKQKKVFIVLELAIVLFSALLPLLFLVVNSQTESAEGLNLARFAFLGISCLSGLLVGAQFPLANSMFLPRRGDIGRAAGILYAADLLGGWLGGVVGAVLLLPVLGLGGTCAVVAMLKIASMVMIATD